MSSLPSGTHLASFYKLFFLGEGKSVAKNREEKELTAAIERQ